MTVERTREALPGDAAEESLNALIERRAQEAEEANRAEAAWAESVRTYNFKRLAERLEEWRAYHRRMIVVHESLAERHRTDLGKLVDGNS